MCDGGVGVCESDGDGCVRIGGRHWGDVGRKQDARPLAGAGDTVGYIGGVVKKREWSNGRETLHRDMLYHVLFMHLNPQTT